MMMHHRQGYVWTGVCLLLLFGCGHDPGKPIEITTIRKVKTVDRRSDPNRSSAERFGYGGEDAPARGDGTSPPPLHWVVPETWEELPSTSMRMMNLRVAGHPDAECYLTMLPGTAGGLKANLNRWRGQMGQPILDDDQIAALQRVEVLGHEAVFIEIVGAYAGMDGAAKADYGMLGVICQLTDRTLFVKMTGPAEILENERMRFLALCKSIR